MSSRHWSAYEKTQLARAGLSALLHSTTTDIPVEYLTHQVNFCDTNFEVSPAVLIPRIETEDLVQFALIEVKKFLSEKSQITIVEVGTGSGAIGLSLWQKITQENLRNHCELSLLDVSSSALEIAKKNYAQLFAPTEKVTIRKMDLLSEWPITQKIDLLIANLPYIPTARIKKLESSVRDFEPHLALDGGYDGLTLIKKLLFQAVNYLNTAGIIWLEIDESHTLEQFQAFGLPFQYQTALDCFGKPRFIKVIRQ